MSHHQQILLGMGENIVVGDSADFDGTNDFMSRGADLTGNADGKTGILSLWIRFDGAADGTGFREIFDSTWTLGVAEDRFRLQTPVSNVLQVVGLRSTGAATLQLSTVSTFPGADTTWFHFLSSWDVATAGAHNLYLNDVSDKTVDVFANNTIKYTAADWSVGSTPVSGGSKLNGCLAEFYFAPNQFLDFSVTANRRKFISASGKPVFLGADGALPTGTAPLIYLHLGRGETASNFATNRATGGNFSITGALTTGSTAP